MDRALAFPVSDWQSIQFNSGYSDFFKMCDAIEEGRHCGNGSTALHHRAVAKARAKKLTARFAAWFKNKYLPGCEYQIVKCLNEVHGANSFCQSVPSTTTTQIFPQQTQAAALTLIT